MEIKIVLLLGKNVCIDVKKGISEFLCEVAPKHTAIIFLFHQNKQCVEPKMRNKRN